MANPKFDNDPIIRELRKTHRKQGPNPLPGEPIDKWAVRYMAYARHKHKKDEKSRQGKKGADILKLFENPTEQKGE